MAILVSILCLAVLIVIHEAGHFAAARLFKMRVKRFSIGFFKPLVEWKPRGSETTYALGAVPLGGYVQIDGLGPVDEIDPADKRSYANQPMIAKLSMVMAGPVANFLTAVILFAILYAAGMVVPVDEPVVGSVKPRMVAAVAGLREGDRLRTIAGKAVATWDEMAQEIQRNRGKAVGVVLERGEEVIELTLTPEPGSGLIGIGPATRIAEPLGPLDAVGQAFVLAGATTAAMAVGIWRMVTGQRTTAGVTGPVGIVQMIRDAFEQGWRAFFWLMAQLSISLCLFNFLPIPALDGGRVTFLAVEAVSRRRVNRTVEGYVHAVGLLLVLGLILLVTFRDVLHLL
jgi:regulator of sigma E protease